MASWVKALVVKPDSLGWVYWTYMLRGENQVPCVFLWCTMVCIHAHTHAHTHTHQHMNTQINKWRQSFELLIIILEVQQWNLGQASVPTTCKVGCWGSVNIQTHLWAWLCHFSLSEWTKWHACLPVGGIKPVWCLGEGVSDNVGLSLHYPALFKPFPLKNELVSPAKDPFFSAIVHFSLPHPPPEGRQLHPASQQSYSFLK